MFSDCVCLKVCANEDLMGHYQISVVNPPALSVLTGTFSHKQGLCPVCTLLVGATQAAVVWCTRIVLLVCSNTFNLLILTSNESNNAAS